MASSDRQPPEITVVGSANLDLVVAVERHPRPGETVSGGDLRRLPGGKGANQATAASRLGRRTAMVGCVGDDDAGALLARALDEAGVDIRHLSAVPGVPTGTALITVAADGDNAIVVSPGANASLTPMSVADAAPIEDAAVLLLQLEVPLATVTAAAQRGSGTVILNPAPAPAAPLAPDLLEAIDVLVPNETELAALTGVDPAAAADELAEAARCLGVPTVVVTLGARGALVVGPRAHEGVPAPVVEPVDTTAAGDAFCAALADGLLAHPGDAAAATRWAVRVGAATTLRPGAGPSLPTASEVGDLLIGARQ